MKKTSKKLTKHLGRSTVKYKKTPIKRKIKVSQKDGFAFLAPLIEIKYIDKFTGKPTLRKFPRNKSEIFWLVWNPYTKELWGMRKSKLVEIDPLQIDYKKTKAYKIYKDFNGYEDLKLDKTKIKTPFKWEEVGKAVHILYHSDKNNRGQFYDYIHPFGDNGYIQLKDHGVNFYYDWTNRIFKVSGGKLTVNERGIVY